jgi:hypothetical protein
MRVKALSLIESLLNSRRECLCKRSLTFMSINSCWPYEDQSREMISDRDLPACLPCTVERLFLSIQLTFVSVYPAYNQWWESNRFIRKSRLVFFSRFSRHSTISEHSSAIVPSREVEDLPWSVRPVCWNWHFDGMDCWTSSVEWHPEKPNKSISTVKWTERR